MAELIVVTGGSFTLEPERIQGDLRTTKPPARIGINLDQPVTEATVRVTVTPIGR